MSSFLLATPWAFAQQPPDVVNSDAFGNTAMGTAALQSDQPTNNNDPNFPGDYNTAGGVSALTLNTSGSRNTAFGASALESNITGNQNTAVGNFALDANTGSANTAIGDCALCNNQGGMYNTASGLSALYSNRSGSSNTADGHHALYSNTTSSSNTATGDSALYSNTTGSPNSAFGASALYSNTIGAFNVATGNASLYHNVNGGHNTADGEGGLYSNVSGNGNTAVGQNALRGIVSGNGNIALGAAAGELLTGSYNIDIGNVGGGADNGVIRVGVEGAQRATYVAGIFGTTVTGSAVYVTASGQLGVLASAERYKTVVERMGGSTRKLTQLRPVTFKLKTDPSGTVQYGLIAEEVAKVYPELVIRNDDGRIDGVRYEELAPMLLNEMQRQQRQLNEQAQQLSALQQRISEVKNLEAKLQKLSVLVQSAQFALARDNGASIPGGL